MASVYKCLNCKENSLLVVDIAEHSCFFRCYRCGHMERKPFIEPIKNKVGSILDKAMKCSSGDRAYWTLTEEQYSELRTLTQS